MATDLRKTTNDVGGGAAAVVCRVHFAVRIARSAEDAKEGASLVVKRGAGGGVLTITRRHPVLVDNKWQRAADAIIPSDEGEGNTDDDGHGDDDRSEWLYNLVLEEEGCAVNVGGVACVPWGHGIDGPLVGHAYYGSAGGIVQDLASMPESDGLVTVRGVYRDTATNKTSGIF